MQEKQTEKYDKFINQHLRLFGICIRWDIKPRNWHLGLAKVEPLGEKKKEKKKEVEPLENSNLDFIYHKLVSIWVH